MTQTRQEKLDQIRDNAIRAFNATPNLKGCLKIGTGVGKSKISLDLANRLLDALAITDPVLILVPLEKLRDSNWLTEIQKFNFTHPIQLECYQTVYKWTDRQFSIVIADEWDFALTPEYSKFFENNKIFSLIALTAFIPESKIELGEKFAPVCFEYSTQDAQRDGVLNKSRFFNIYFDLNFQQNIKVETKKKKTQEALVFYTSENKQYTYLQDGFMDAVIAQSKAEREGTTAGLLNDAPSIAEATQKATKAMYQLKMFARKRKEFLHNLESSAEIARYLVDQILLANPENKVLVFSALTDQANKITQNPFHSKSNDDTVIDSLSRGEIRAASVCQAINRGVNIHGLNYLIKESYVGSETDFQQQHGRGTRLDIDETMTFVTLIPMYSVYSTVVENGRSVRRWVKSQTQAAVWAANMKESFNIESKDLYMEFDSVSKTYRLPTAQLNELLNV